MMVEWPGRCGQCGESIEDWNSAGFDSKRWVHKTCFSKSTTNQRAASDELRSPLDRGSQLELPMFISLLLFHFGIGTAVVGWIILTQDNATTSDSLGVILLAAGLIMPLIGIAGIALNIMGRRHIETVRQQLDLQGGWKPS